MKLHTDFNCGYGTPQSNMDAMLSVMSERISLRERVILERRALRVLCGGAQDPALHEECLQILAGYRFAEPEHQVVYDALRRIPSGSASTIRQELTVQLNNQGFPDLELGPFFQPLTVSPSAALKVLRRLANYDGRAIPKVVLSAKST